jgi:hypothetical protein
MNNSLNILDAIVSCDYLMKNRDLIISIFFDTFSTGKSEIFITIKFNKATDKFEKILVVRFPINVSLQGNKYEVSMLTYFPKLFPAEAPQFYIERTEPIGVNSQCKIVNNKTLQIITPGITRWSVNNANVNEIINEIAKDFNLNFPVYKLYKNSKTIDYGEDCRLINDNLQKVSFDAESKLDLEKKELFQKHQTNTNNQINFHSFDDMRISNNDLNKNKIQNYNNPYNP